MRWRKLYEIGRDTVFRFLDNGGPLLSAALAFYSLISAAPVVLTAIFMAGLVFGEDAAAGTLQEQLSHYIGLESAQTVGKVVTALREAQTGTHATLIGAGLILFTASRLFSQLQDALNQLWRVRTEFKNIKAGVIITVYKKLIALALVLTIGAGLTTFLLIMAVASTAKGLLGTALPGAEWLYQSVPVVCTTLLITAMFTMIYRWVPNARVAWRDAAVGAAVAAVLFTMAEWPLSYYLTHGAVGSALGAAGSFIVFPFWVYYSAQIFFIGAQLCRVLADDAGRQPRPDDMAVIIKEIPVEQETSKPSAQPSQSEQRQTTPRVPTGSLGGLAKAARLPQPGARQI